MKVKQNIGVGMAMLASAMSGYGTLDFTISLDGKGEKKLLKFDVVGESIARQDSGNGCKALVMDIREIGYGWLGTYAYHGLEIGSSCLEFEMPDD